MNKIIAGLRILIICLTLFSGPSSFAIGMMKQVLELIPLDQFSIDKLSLENQLVYNKFIGEMNLKSPTQMINEVNYLIYYDESAPSENFTFKFLEVKPNLTIKTGSFQIPSVGDKNFKLLKNERKADFEFEFIIESQSIARGVRFNERRLFKMLDSNSHLLRPIKLYLLWGRGVETSNGSFQLFLMTDGIQFSYTNSNQDKFYDVIRYSDLGFTSSKEIFDFNILSNGLENIVLSVTTLKSNEFLKFTTFKFKINLDAKSYHEPIITEVKEIFSCENIFL